LIENKENDKKYACKSFSKEQVQKELKGKVKEPILHFSNFITGIFTK